MYENVALRGEGVGKTVLTVSTLTNSSVFAEPSDGAHNIELSDMTIDMNSSNNGCINFENGDNRTLRNLKIINQDAGVGGKWTIHLGDYATGSGAALTSRNNVIDNVHIENCHAGTAEQILFVNQLGGKITNCFFKENTSNAAYEVIAYINNRDVVIENNSFEDGDANSMATMESSGVQFINNTVRNSKDFKAYTIINSENVTIDGGSLTNTAGGNAVAIEFFDRLIGPDGFTQIVDDTNNVTIKNLNAIDGYSSLVSCRIVGNVAGTDYTMSQNNITIRNNVIKNISSAPFILGEANALNFLQNIFVYENDLQSWSGTNVGALQLRGNTATPTQMGNIYIERNRFVDSTGGGSWGVVRIIGCRVNSLIDNFVEGAWTGYGVISTANSGALEGEVRDNRGYPTEIQSTNTTLETANFTATAGVRSLVDTSAAVTVTSPASPYTGMTFAITDANFQASVNNITVDFGTDNYYGSTGTDVLNVDGDSLTYEYIDATTGWIRKDGR